jgi:hypothetical protein
MRYVRLLDDGRFEIRMDTRPELDKGEVSITNEQYDLLLDEKATVRDGVVVEYTPQELQQKVAEQETAKAEWLVEQETESLIQAKIREQAITALKAEGKLTMDGKIAEVAK